jgi:hypothetical protein
MKPLVALKSSSPEEANLELEAIEMSNDMIELYERDIQIFMEFIESFDMFAVTTIDDYTVNTDEHDNPVDNRKLISYQEYISKSKTMINKGFTDLVANSAVQNIIDICKFLNKVVMKSLLEMAHKIDEIHKFNTQKTTKAVGLIDDNRSLMQRNLQISQSIEQLEKENLELKSLASQAFELLHKVEAITDIKEALTPIELEKIQSFMPEVVVSNDVAQENIDESKTKKSAANKKWKPKPII